MLLSKACDRQDIAISYAAQLEHSEESLLQPGCQTTLDLTAFVSCYNEANYIIHTLDDICSALHEVGISFEIIVIDDCSTDNSFDLVSEYIKDHQEERIVLLRNAKNKGLAQNYIDGAFLGKGKYYKLFCGDNPEPRESIVEICRHLGEADMIIPTYNTVAGKSFSRRLLSRSYTFLVNLVSGHRITYYNGLPVHLRSNVTRWHPNTRGFGFQADIACMLLDRGATYVEVMVANIHRPGSRALTLKNTLSVGHTLTELLIRRVANWFYGK
jgi:glycosyltransferase involved in cell wall biosynthesis